jgi:hypothetical protein
MSVLVNKCKNHDDLQVFANPEDAKMHKIKPKFDDDDVERVRR